MRFAGGCDRSEITANAPLVTFSVSPLWLERRRFGALQRWIKGDKRHQLRRIGDGFVRGGATNRSIDRILAALRTRQGREG